jgi:peptidoglycan hydrolase-like protein with peptidoglycan-binding domain
MFLASKAAWAGIVFLLLTSGISPTRQIPLASEAKVSKEVPAVAQQNDVQQNDVKKIQVALQGNGQYAGRKVDGVFGLRTRASIRGFQKAENLPITGQLDAETAGQLGVRPEGREQTAYEATPGKPSAGIKWDAGSKRRSKTQPKAIKKTTRAVPPPA